MYLNCKAGFECQKRKRDHQDYALIKKYAGVSEDEIRVVEEELFVK